MAACGGHLYGYPPLAAPYVPWAGAAGVLLGAILTGVRRAPEGRFAAREVVLLLCVCGSLTLSAAVILGGLRGWEPRTVGALLIGAWAQTVAAVIVTLRLALTKERSKGLFGVGAAGATLLAIGHGVLLVLGLG
ncbi:MAG: hypothetical protein R3F62_08750 [Planctomycetota bacterium]